MACQTHGSTAQEGSLPRCLEGGVDQQWSRETSYSSRRKTQKQFGRGFGPDEGPLGAVREFGVRGVRRRCSTGQEREQVPTSRGVRPKSPARPRSVVPRGGPDAEDVGTSNECWGRRRQVILRHVTFAHDGNVHEGVPEEPIEERSSKPPQPWWIILRKFKQLRRVRQQRDEGRPQPSPHAKEGEASPPKDLQGVRSRGDPRIGCGGGSNMDTTRLGEEAKLGEIQRHLQVRPDGCCSVRVDPLRTGGVRGGSTRAEPQSQVGECVADGRLAVSLAADRVVRPDAEERVRRLEARNVHHSPVREFAGEVEETRQGGEAAWTCRRRRRGRRGREAQVNGQSVHVEGKMVDPALIGSNSKFLKYLSWLENSLGTLPVVAGAQKPLFPCSLPYPEACSEGFAVAGVDSVSMWAKRRLNVMVAFFNYLVLGCPRVQWGNLRAAGSLSF